MKPQHAYKIERIVTAEFRRLCDELGAAKALRVFDEAGLNDDQTWPGKDVHARAVVGKLLHEERVA